MQDPQFIESIANTLGIDIGLIDDADELMRDGLDPTIDRVGLLTKPRLVERS